MKLASMRDYTVTWKYRISYLSGFLTSFAATVIIANTIQDKLTTIGINVHYVLILAITIIGVLVGAYLLDRGGFIESEIDYSNSKNKLLNEIKGGK